MSAACRPPESPTPRSRLSPIRCCVRPDKSANPVVPSFQTRDAMMREGFIREDAVRGVVDPCYCYYATRIARLRFRLLCSSLLEALETCPCPSWPISSLPGSPVTHVYCCIARRQETCMSCPLASGLLRSNLARSSPLGPLKAFRLMRDVSRTFRPSRCGPSLLHNAYYVHLNYSTSYKTQPTQHRHPGLSVHVPRRGKSSQSTTSIVAQNTKVHTETLTLHLFQFMPVSLLFMK